MKLKLLSILSTVLVSVTISAQTNPTITSWVINTTNKTGYNCSGCSPAVNGTIPTDVQSVYYTSTNVYISASGVPSYNVGPWASNPNVPKNQNKIWKITLTPAENTGTKTATALGLNGVWSNGSGIYNPKDGYYWNNTTQAMASPGSGTWNRNAFIYEAVSFDACLGHADGSGSYHNHVNPKCLYDATASTSHSPIIGYAFDGFPIYGAFGYANANGSGGITRMTSSYAVTTATTRASGPNMTSTYSGSIYAAGSFCEDYIYTQGSGTLDSYNGRFSVTPEYPSGIYCYFVTIDANGTPVYPFVLGPSYYGTVQSGNTGPTGGANTIPSGATLYTAVITSLETIESLPSFVVFPNPSSGQEINIKAVEGSKSLSIQVVDCQGRTIVSRVYNGLNANEVVTVSTPYLNPGAYWLRLESDGKVSTKQVVFVED